MLPRAPSPGLGFVHLRDHGVRLAPNLLCVWSLTVVLDPRAATLRIGVGASRGLPAGVAMSVVTTADLASTQAGAQGGGGGPAGIAFLPDGSSSGGRVELAAGARHMQVGVDWLTGRVSVADGP